MKLRFAQKQRDRVAGFRALPLLFYVTQQSRNGDRHLYALRTRFIPREIREHLEAVRWAPT